MEVIYSPKGIIWVNSPEWGISMMKKAGLKNLVMDFSLWWSNYILENIGKCGIKLPGNMKNPENPKEMYGLLKPLYTECNSRDIMFPIAVVPYVNPDTRRCDLNVLLYELAEECIRTCGKTGCKYLIVPPLYAGIPNEKLQKANVEYYRRLAVAAKGAGVVLVLKNQCRSINGHLVRGMFCDAEETIRFIDVLNSEFGAESFGFCLDTGICSICGQNRYDFISVLGNRLKALILRDNDGSTDGSLLPFTGTGAKGVRTDWSNLICGLRKVGFDGMLILDFHDNIYAAPNMLRLKYLELARDMGAYFKWQIEQEKVLAKYTSRVLFGAGNMFCNYMRCYGEYYPPLFTCDNNSKLWDTEMEGIMVKNPQELKKLPKDCAIFICNIYYGEIEAQLRDMGIGNPIEYFNDEHMPSFCFERPDLEERKNVRTDF